MRSHRVQSLREEKEKKKEEEEECTEELIKKRAGVCLRICLNFRCGDKVKV